MLKELKKAKDNFVSAPEQDNLQTLIDQAIKLEAEDKLFFKEWFYFVMKDDSMNEFCQSMIKVRSRNHRDWAVDEMIKLQSYYKIDSIPMTLADFNKV